MRHNEEILFRDWQWGECLDYLNNIVLINHGDNIVLVSGELDSGKTTIKQEIINLLPNNFKIFSMYGEPRLGVATFMRQITVGFGLPWDNNRSPDWDELRKAIFSQSEINWVLLIDDAEKLSWDTLNALISLYTTVSAEGSKFNLILFADVSLSGSIKNSVLKDFFETKFQTIEIQPLNLEEMTIFLRDYMQLTFDRKTLKKIYNASGGVIGKVKQLAISELNIKSTGENVMFKNLLENIISPPVIRGFVCGSLLLVAYVLFGVTQKKEVSSIDIALEQETQKTEQKLQLAHAEPITPKTYQQQAIDDTVIPSSTLKAYGPTNIENTQYNQLYQQLHTDLKNSLQDQLSSLQAEINKLQEKIATLSSTTEKSIVDRQSIASINSTITNKPIKIAKASVLQMNSNEKQLLKIAKNRYVLQLMASKNEQSAKRLISSHPSLFDKIKYFPGKFKQQDDVWFVVVHGVYSSRESATKDIKNLPKDLQKLKPIVRDYASVHQLINNNKQL